MAGWDMKMSRRRGQTKKSMKRGWVTKSWVGVGFMASGMSSKSVWDKEMCHRISLNIMYIIPILGASDGKPHAETTCPANCERKLAASKLRLLKTTPVSISKDPRTLASDSPFAMACRANLRKFESTSEIGLSCLFSRGWMSLIG